MSAESGVQKRNPEMTILARSQNFSMKNNEFRIPTKQRREAFSVPSMRRALLTILVGQESIKIGSILTVASLTE